MDRIKQLIAAAVVAAALVAGSAQAERWDSIQQTGRLSVALYDDLAPYSCQNLDGRLVGVDLDLARALAERLGLELDLVPFGGGDSMSEDFEMLRESPPAGEWEPASREVAADVMLHVPLDPLLSERNPEVQILAPYYHESMAVLYDNVALGELPTQITDPQPFVGHRLGVEMYSLSYVFLTNGFNGQLRAGVANHKSVPAAVTALLNGEVSAVFGTRTELQNALAAHTSPRPGLAMSDLGNLFSTNRVRSSWAVGLAIADGNPQLAAQLRQAMEQLDADGTIEDIFANYGIPLVRPGDLGELIPHADGAAPPA
ncbi:hypothetical protein CAI21_18005 [Alkalilimnicola ehrlichii]|uniref:substrate-binding periplasmic protein n=1 Tax=Alkalilimnicola ehrlichii TaxID=351052 RepID=UPI000E2EA4E5|nr:transporter substrate-binding domain-containing protein [Alkalilimnicola ehrlichii]RFA25851.1 hypothetical protein CAI21_18005 [Alkalilimnicola ehrlichii]